LLLLEPVIVPLMAVSLLAWTLRGRAVTEVNGNCARSGPKSRFGYRASYLEKPLRPDEVSRERWPQRVSSPRSSGNFSTSLGCQCVIDHCDNRQIASRQIRAASPER
jgi:hypothetical protein